MVSQKRHSKKHIHSKKDKALLTRRGIVLTVLVIIILVVVAALLNQFVLKKNKVAAKVNGEPIYVDEVENTYARLQGAEKAYVTKGTILGLIIDNKLLLLEAKSLGFGATDDEISAMVNAYRSYMPEGRFDSDVGNDPKKLEQFKSEVSDNIIMQKYLISIMPQIDVSNDEISAFFAQYSQMFSGDMVKASHILVDTEAKALDLLNQIKNGTDFAEIAKANSLDGSAAAGGDLGWFGRGATVAEFEAAAFNLSIGEVSDVVQTQFGYHLIKVMNKTSLRAPELSVVAPLIKASMVNQKVKENVPAFIELVNQLRSGAKIEIIDNFNGTYTTTTEITTETQATIGSTTTLAPATTIAPTTTIAKATLANTCSERYGITNKTIILYYSEENEKSNEMMVNINRLKAQGFLIFKVNRESEYKDDINTLTECYKDVNLQIVPQLVCAQTSAMKVGLIIWEETKAFADACVQ